MAAKLKWDWQKEQTECGKYGLQTEHVRHEGTWYTIWLYTGDVLEHGKRAIKELGTWGTKREALRNAQRHADGKPLIGG